MRGMYNIPIAHKMNIYIWERPFTVTRHVSTKWKRILSISTTRCNGCPAPVALPPHIGEKYLIRPDSLQGWVIQTYMKQKEVLPGRWVQERKLDFYNQFRQYQGTAYHQYTVPYKMTNKAVYLSSPYKK